MFGQLRAWFSGAHRIGVPFGYAICTAPRSGSNVLCQWLSSTGVLGRPLEYFNTPGRRALDDPHYPDDKREQIAWILAKGATANGIYGVKLFSVDSHLVSPVAGVSPSLPVHAYIYLERADRLGQAISWTRALQTQQYRSTQPVQGPIRYDASAIRARLEAINLEYANWSDFFKQHDLRPLRLTYEDATKSPQLAVNEVAAFLRVKQRALIDVDQVTLRMQRDATTTQWRERFTQECEDTDETR
jgi:LPS sulfotransferase NodH